MACVQLRFLKRSQFLNTFFKCDLTMLSSKPKRQHHSVFIPTKSTTSLSIFNNRQLSVFTDNNSNAVDTISISKKVEWNLFFKFGIFIFIWISDERRLMAKLYVLLCRPLDNNNNNNNNNNNLLYYNCWQIATIDMYNVTQRTSSSTQAFA